MHEQTYERLSRLDESFLAFEKPNTYMHVAMLCVFDGGSLCRPRGGLDMQRIKTHLGSRLSEVPRYRQRLCTIPIVDQLAWIDDAQFDLDCHLRHSSLPKPGSQQQLQRLCARILERPLDRTRPLWEMWMIEGLPSGQFAMLAKVHHCMVDGVAGVGVLAALLGSAPETTVRRGPRWRPRPAPAPSEMARREMLRRGRASITFAARIGSSLADPRGAVSALASRASALRRLVDGGTGQTPTTPFNQTIGSHRRVDWLAVDLSRVKEVKNRLGGTVNDVVLATVAGALGEFFDRKNIDRPPNFRTVVPVNVRASEEKDQLGNRVSVWFLSLPLRTRDPQSRMRQIQAATARLKEGNDSAGAQILTDAVDWTGSSVLRTAASLLNRTHVYNMIVTNVPGPDVPLYLLDARLVSAYPFVPLFNDQGLGVALFSYAGSLHWGLGADWDLLPDLHLFRDALASSFEALHAASCPAPKAPRRRRQRSRTSTRRLRIVTPAEPAHARDRLPASTKSPPLRRNSRFA